MIQLVGLNLEINEFPHFQLKFFLVFIRLNFHPILRFCQLLLKLIQHEVPVLHHLVDILHVLGSRISSQQNGRILAI